MLIQMRYQMSGSRHDGRPWPVPDVDFEVPYWEGVDLIRGGMAVPSGKDAEKIARDLAEQPTPGHPSKLDSRPASQVEGEELARKSAEEQGLAGGVAASAGPYVSPVAEASPVAEVPGPVAEPPGELPSLAPDVAVEDGAGSPGVPEPDGQATAEPVPAAAAPGPSAPKQSWIDYAVNVRGADIHAATQMTKADLMSRYGGRL